MGVTGDNMFVCRGLSRGEHGAWGTSVSRIRGRVQGIGYVCVSRHVIQSPVHRGAWCEYVCALWVSVHGCTALRVVVVRVLRSSVSCEVVRVRACVW